MVFDPTIELTNYVRSKNHLAGETSSLNLQTQSRDERTLRKLWEMSELSANDFADKVAEFFQLPRISLPDLLAAPALAKQFSPRFLREMTVFPYRSPDGSAMLASPIPAILPPFAQPRSCSVKTSVSASHRSKISKRPSTSASLTKTSRCTRKR